MERSNVDLLIEALAGDCLAAKSAQEKPELARNISGNLFLLSHLLRYVNGEETQECVKLFE